MCDIPHSAARRTAKFRLGNIVITGVRVRGSQKHVSPAEDPAVQAAKITRTGAIVGVGAARRLSAVRWNVASNIIVAWTVTLPAAAAIGAGTYWLTGLFT